MKLLKKFAYLGICIVLNCMYGTKGETNWDYELLDVTVENNWSDANLNMNLKRLSRTDIVLEGYIDIINDLYDDTYIKVDIFRSAKGNEASYIRTPFLIPETNLSEAFNKLFRKFVWPTVKECSKDFPNFEKNDEKFVVPLTPRRMEFNECILQTDNMPKDLNPGYYRVITTIFNDNGNFKIIMTIKIEDKN